MSELPDFLSEVVAGVRESIRQGYYDLAERVDKADRPSLRNVVENTRLPIIGEIKPRSPSLGRLIDQVDVDLALSLERVGASAISIIVERTHFDGSLELLCKASQRLGVPVLFKDFVVGSKQVEAAYKGGADIILLIAELFRDGYTELPLNQTIRLAHSMGLEVLLEFHDPQLLPQVVESEADYIGVNNRDLYTLNLYADHFYNLAPKLGRHVFKVAESGYSECGRIARDRRIGAHAFLIGSAIMSSVNPPEKLRELLDCDQD
ncbi:MAG: indole-3-glycerol-phosphate synthase [Thermoprotei archaeon]